MTQPITVTTFTDDDCKKLRQQLNSKNESEIATAFQQFVDNPCSFDLLVARMEKLGDGLFSGCDIRTAVSKLSANESTIPISQILRALDVGDETIQFWTACGLPSGFYTITTPIFIKCIKSPNEYVSSHSISELCEDEANFASLDDEQKLEVIQTLHNIFSNATYEAIKPESAHTVMDPLAVAIYYLSKVLPNQEIERFAEALRQMAHHEQTDMRYEAIRGLGGIAERVKPTFSNLFLSIEQELLLAFQDSDSTVRQEALLALSKIKSKHELSLALCAADDSESSIQSFAIFLLTRYFPFTPSALRARKRYKPANPYMTHQKLHPFQKMLSYIPFF